MCTNCARNYHTLQWIVKRRNSNSRRGGIFISSMMIYTCLCRLKSRSTRIYLCILLSLTYSYLNFRQSINISYLFFSGCNYAKRKLLKDVKTKEVLDFFSLFSFIKTVDLKNSQSFVHFKLSTKSNKWCTVYSCSRLLWV